MRSLAGFSSSFLSAVFARPPRANEVIRPKSPGRIARYVHSGSTFNAGRNAEKRGARRREKLMRLAQIEALQIGVIGFAPKKHQSHLTIDMLANRRLRQRGQVRG